MTNVRSARYLMLFLVCASLFVCAGCTGAAPLPAAPDGWATADIDIVSYDIYSPINVQPILCEMVTSCTRSGEMPDAQAYVVWWGDLRCPSAMLAAAGDAFAFERSVKQRARHRWLIVRPAGRVMSVDRLSYDDFWFDTEKRTAILSFAVKRDLISDHASWPSGVVYLAICLDGVFTRFDSLAVHFKCEQFMDGVRDDDVAGWLEEATCDVALR